MHEDDDVNSIDLEETEGEEKEEECIKVRTKDELQTEKQALLREKQAVEDSLLLSAIEKVDIRPESTRNFRGWIIRKVPSELKETGV